jgi:DNA-binding transcriptional MerR regulator
MNDKESYNIQEVCEIVELPSHIICYWENEFPVLTPERDEFRRRIYSRKDVYLIARIRQLLYERRYTIAETKAVVSEEFR